MSYKSDLHDDEYHPADLLCTRLGLDADPAPSKWAFTVDAIRCGDMASTDRMEWTEATELYARLHRQLDPKGYHSASAKDRSDKTGAVLRQWRYFLVDSITDGSVLVLIQSSPSGMLPDGEQWNGNRITGNASFGRIFVIGLDGTDPAPYLEDVPALEAA